MARGAQYFDPYFLDVSALMNTAMEKPTVFRARSSDGSMNLFLATIMTLAVPTKGCGVRTAIAPQHHACTGDPLPALRAQMVEFCAAHLSTYPDLVQSTNIKYKRSAFTTWDTYLNAGLTPLGFLAEHRTSAAHLPSVHELIVALLPHMDAMRMPILEDVVYMLVKACLPVDEDMHCFFGRSDAFSLAAIREEVITVLLAQPCLHNVGAFSGRARCHAQTWLNNIDALKVQTGDVDVQGSVRTIVAGLYETLKKFLRDTASLAYAGHHARPLL